MTLSCVACVDHYNERLFVRIEDMLQCARILNAKNTNILTRQQNQYF